MEFEIRSEHAGKRGVRVVVPSEDHPPLMRLRAGRIATHGCYVDLNYSEAMVVARAIRAMAEGMDRDEAAADEA